INFLTWINSVKIIVVWFMLIFKKRITIPRLPEMRAEVKRNRGIAIFSVVLGACAMPGLYMASPLYRPAIKITPMDYEITYKWWMHVSNLSQYDDQTLDELNEHSCTLDICGYAGIPTQDDIESLKQLEARLPNCTYRFVEAGPNISQIIANTKVVLEIMVEYENNGTLHNWEGVTFDIENPTFETRNGFNSTQECIDAWEDLFAWKRQLEQQRISGREIVVESVHSDRQINDFWDGDPDLQSLDGYVSVSPTDGWSVYAPMLYRCWPTDPPPYGISDGVYTSPKEFTTNYDFYTALYQAVNRLPIEKRGAYIGITNCSCYGRDIPQDPDIVTWYLPEENGTPTGFGNLVRDVLICKHFGIREVTFFLLKTASDDGINVMGGAFESYGYDFLDKMDYYVNQNPPDHYNIYYNAEEKKGAEFIKLDWMCNISRVDGLAVILILLGLASVINLKATYIKSRLFNIRKNT
ncbi:MAG: hypothetical protein ACTSWN_11655, partial [Promethearchaeota archaeon]